MPLASPKHDGRPIEWMFIDQDDVKPLVQVREELLREKLVRACSEDMMTEVSVRLPSLSGRTLHVGESPPF